MIVEVKNLSDVISLLEDIPENQPLFVDIDDTVITPQSLAFRKSPSKEMIDRLKKNPDRPYYLEILSNWRLQRKTILVNSLWPRVIEEEKKKRQVYALTKMDTGKCGNIPSMEEWRFKELEAHGIQFSDNRLISAFIPSSNFSNPPTFYKGIFITGAASKSEVLELYKDVLWPREQKSRVILIDDRKEVLQEMESFCNSRGWQFLGIHYREAEDLPGVPDPEVAAFQEAYLLENARWWEDEEAQERLKKLL